MLTVVLDTNVLYPPVLQDLLVGLAIKGFFRARWSDEILEELERNLLKRLAPTVVKGRIRQLRELLPDAMVKPDQGAFGEAQNDPKDRHVVAAAITSGADVIVTLNLKDFEPMPAGITAMTPDVFLGEFADQLDEVIGVLEWIASQWPKPPSSELLLEKLEVFLPEFVAEAQRRM